MSLVQFSSSKADSGVGEPGCWLQYGGGDESHKGAPVGQGACCQIKSKHGSGPAGENEGFLVCLCSRAGRFIAPSGTEM